MVERCREALDGIDAINVADLADLRLREWAKDWVVLIGDAAAAFLPSAGVGASVAMESAAVLNDELSRADAAHMPNAIRFYLMRRRERVDAIQSVSRRLLKTMLPGNAVLAAGRNWLTRRLSEDRFFRPLGRWMDRSV
ncbi:MAG: FAD-dependent oxidoreductase [Methylocella sp.]